MQFESNTTINNSALAGEKKMIQFIFSTPDFINSSMVYIVFNLDLIARYIKKIPHLL